MNSDNDEAARLRIDGIDVAGGLNRFGGRLDTYLQVLRSFLEHVPHALSDLRQAEPTLRSYTVLVHGIKGSCYGIGADSLGKKAEALEIASKAGDRAGVAAVHDIFLAEAEDLLARLSACLAEVEGAKPDAPPKTLQPAPDGRTLLALLEAASQYDITAMGQAMTALTAFDYQAHGDFVQQLGALVADFSYDQVQTELEAFLEVHPSL
ncbi:MAG: Hpt domain-containing protein [Oscillospiraceae bacterium]|jgi:HPt (histidine-containing phosphotransfer) domain-containing protein|nr:Hpt domain-containing protein [Oscillospiraceae bacterium]